MIDIENLTERDLAVRFSQMSDAEVHESAVRLEEKERRITLALLRHLNEIERRHLFSKFSVSSLHGYCMKELKMSDGAAGRRVSAARLLRDLPAIEEKILTGAVNLTSVSQASVFFRKEALSGRTFDLGEKRELLEELENKSTLEVDRILISKSDQPEIHLREKIIPRSDSLTEVRLHLDDETMTALNRLKEIWSHSIPNASLADVIKRAAAETVEKQDPLRERLAPPPERPKTHAEVKRHVWSRDQARCTFADERTGERCCARHFVEEDHVVPKAMGGAYSIENIRLRCRAHNQRHAIDCYGEEKMLRHLREERAN